MSNQLQDFGNIAKGLSRNPLGIIALFIVLVYGFAALVTTFNSSFTHAERLPLVYFLVIFPVLVLGVFTWLVSAHSNKLFAPSDFKNEDNYIKMQMSVVGSLVAASSKDKSPSSETEIKDIVELVQDASSSKRAFTQGNTDAKNLLLWVDDRPDNNINERQAFEALGLRFTLALSTKEALDKISEQRYAAIISDMGRKEGPREGYVLLDTLRKRGIMTPLFFYAASNAPEHIQETLEHGGQGCTNRAQELFQMVTRLLINGR
jgi:CheY-like chemotaxis protein